MSLPSDIRAELAIKISKLESDISAVEGKIAEMEDRLGVVEERSIAAYNMADEACEMLDICGEDVNREGE